MLMKNGTFLIRIARASLLTIISNSLSLLSVAYDTIVPEDIKVVHIDIEVADISKLLNNF